MPENATQTTGGSTSEIAIKPNPAPQQPYTLTLAFSDLPGKPSEVKGTLDFEVSNLDCVPMDYKRAVGGVKLAPQHSVPVEFRLNDQGSYIARVNADALLDEDYYGLGVCHWALASATVHFRSPSTRFVGGAGADAVMSGDSVTQHYLVNDFNKKPDVMDIVFGEDSPTFYQASAGPQFTMTMSARKETP